MDQIPTLHKPTTVKIISDRVGLNEEIVLKYKKKAQFYFVFTVAGTSKYEWDIMIVYWSKND